MPSPQENEKAPESFDPPPWIGPKDRRYWKPLYPDECRRRQRYEGWLLLLATTSVIVTVYFLWRFYDGSLKPLILAGTGGLLGGLLQDCKFFYKSVGDGNWIWDKSWWRLLTPVMAAAMGFSVYIIFVAFVNHQPNPKEDWYAYGIGFLTGLFADNALQKLRDIAYTVFGTPKAPLHKLHPVPIESQENETPGK